MTLLTAHGITKRYDANPVLEDAEICIEDGEVHGLLGHNGSGKSTLIRVLAGVVSPDAGVLIVRGEPVTLPVRPSEADRLGLRFVHQNLALVPTLSVAENLLLLRFTLGGGAKVNWRRVHADAEALLARFAVEVDSHARVDSLDAVDQARVAIVRAVAAPRPGATDGAAILVLDEPTVFLPRREVADLFALIRRLADEGAGVLIVSHRMSEILDHTDRVTVLRDGRNIVTQFTRDTSEAALLKAIVGPQGIARPGLPGAGTVAVAPEAPPVCTVAEGVRTRRLKSIDLKLHRGEIHGLTGLAGGGYEELLYALYGCAPSVAGLFFLDGRRVELRDLTPARALELGIALVPADRAGQGIIGVATVEENLTAPALSDHYRRGLLRTRQMTRAAAAAIAEFDIRPANPRLHARILSGGNQQKVVMAKWLRRGPRLLLLHEPTQGVDVAAREAIRQDVRRMAAEGCTVLYGSTDHDDLAAVCTAVTVINNGRVAASLRGRSVDKHHIAAATLQGA